MPLTYRLSEVVDCRPVVFPDGKFAVELLFKYIRVHIVVDNEQVRDALIQYLKGEEVVRMRHEKQVRMPRFTKG